ncbi:glycosyltransferase [Streptomyces sp. NPDC048568]|uniref:glycosyltransferase n=1 Tax=Streptomyces sp. NPDC048568 TaxID=3365571 RepID=UPI003710CA13
MSAGQGGAGPGNGYAVVVPTLVRDSLADCLAALAAATGPGPDEIVLVDDRPGSRADPGALEHPLTVLGDLRERTVVLRSGGRGPAAARNTGLRAVTAPWTAFLDDDVQVGPHWCGELIQDLAEAAPDTGAVQGVIAVPLPGERRPTDWERDTAGLARARWTNADMAYRTVVLRQVGGFDERFTRAFREDADLALRVLDAGWRIRRGRRTTRHPVPPAARWVSLGQQRANADDALMRRLHGPDCCDIGSGAAGTPAPLPPAGAGRDRAGHRRPHRGGRHPGPAAPGLPGAQAQGPGAAVRLTDRTPT